MLDVVLAVAAALALVAVLTVLRRRRRGAGRALGRDHGHPPDLRAARAAKAATDQAVIARQGGQGAGQGGIGGGMGY